MKNYYCIHEPEIVPYGTNTGSGEPEYTTYGIQHSRNFGASSTDIKDLSRWPTHLYYNVWIVNDIYPTWIAGFANYPNGSDYDGSVVVYSC